MKTGRIPKYIKKKLLTRRAFRRGHEKCSDEQYIAELAITDVPVVVLLAVRKALATECGIPPQYIRPDTRIEELRPLMANLRSRMWETDVGGCDLFEFLQNFEEILNEDGPDLKIPESVLEKIPFFGYSKMSIFPGPQVPIVEEWMRIVATIISSDCSFGPSEDPSGPNKDKLG